MKLLPYWETKDDRMAGLRQNAVMYCAVHNLTFAPPHVRQYYDALIPYSMGINTPVEDALMDAEFEGNIRAEEYAS